jgi:major inositol transporter-like SP family MFS transporter
MRMFESLEKRQRQKRNNRMLVPQTVGIQGPSEKRIKFFVRITAGTAALAGLLFGFDTGVISGAILFIKGEFGLTPFAEELLVSAVLLGAVCGATLSGRLTDLRGRKRAIFGTACLFAIGSILCAIAPSAGVLILGRIAVGVASYTAPTLHQ